MRRVLRDDGVLFLNLGDSYAGSMKGMGADGKAYAGQKQATNVGSVGISPPDWSHISLKPKDLCGIPWRVALALQADGWWLRSDIIWAKTNPMPESVRDRCTKSHEYVFMLAKSKKYYFDADAIREVYTKPMDRWGGETLVARGKSGWDNGTGQQMYRTRNMRPNPAGRNKRSVWRADNILYEFLRFAEEQGIDIDALAVAFIEGQSQPKDVWTLSTKPFKGAHFAVFPEALIHPMILAGTSARGACPECQAPWERVVERKAMVIDRSKRTHPMGRTRPSGTMVEPAQSRTLGWRPICTCPGLDGDSPWPILEMHPDGEANWPTVPCLVLDPFLGSGTTAVVAKKLERSYIGIELNPEYIKMAERRLAKIDGIQLRLPE